MIRVARYSENRGPDPLSLCALSNGFQVESCSTEIEFNQLLSTQSWDLLILNLSTGPNLLQRQIIYFKRFIERPIPCIITADDHSRPAVAELIRHGAYGFCPTSSSAAELIAIMQRACAEASFKDKPLPTQQPKTEEAQCGRLIGSSPQMRHVYDLVRRVSNISASVLITGESGTGKELIASAIHQLSPSADKPLVAVSCGAIPETLIESELFGHDKGAFTGSSDSRLGYLEHAGDGTLFLDEIAELSLATQVKLLRVLQQREFSPLGSSRLIPLRARMIFATHKDLESMVTAQTFRHDLYYRINVIRIDAPTLRERPEDLPQLALHFLQHYSELYDKPITRIEQLVMNALQDYSWPGNVRELENVIQRAIILANDDTISMRCLPPDLLDKVAVQGEGVLNIGDYRPSSFESRVRDFKFNTVTNAIRENKGNKTLAARALKISRAYLHRLIRVPDSDDPTEIDSRDLESA